MLKRLLWSLAIGLGLSTPVGAQFGTGIVERTHSPAVTLPVSGSLVSERLDDGSERVEEILATRDDWDFGQLPLGEVVKQLRERFNLVVHVDVAAMNEEGVDPAAPLPWPTGKLQLQTVLRMGLCAQGLQLHVEHGVLTLTTQTRCEGSLILNRIYTVRDQDRGTPTFDDIVVISLVEGFTSGWFVPAEPAEGVVLIGPTPDSLIVRHTWQIHREVEQLFRELRRAREQQGLPVFRTEAFDRSHQSIDEGLQRLQKVLATSEDWKLGELSPRELAAWLRQRFEIPVYLDPQALQDEGVDPDQKLSWVEGRMTLEAWLTTALQPQGLAIDVEDDLLIVTTQTKLAENFVNRVYPVADLVAGDPDSAEAYDSLREIIEQATSGRWDHRHEGVCGSVSAWPAACSLIVRQDRGVQREVEQLLQGLRRSLGVERPPLEPRDPHAALFLNADDERLEAVLATRDEWNFGTMTLGGVADALSRRFRIPVQIDKAVLLAEKVDPDIPIEWLGGVISLENLLSRGLSQHGLHYYVDDGVLLISTRSCDNLLHTRLYRIADLTRPETFAEDAKLILQIMQQTCSGQWEEIDGVGGTATIMPAVKAIVVNQTRTAHRDIERALQMLRKAQ